MIARFLPRGGVSERECILFGFFMGFVQDVYTPEYLGYNTFTMTIMGFVLGVLRETITVENSMVKIAVTVIACLAHDILYLSFYTVFDYSLLLRILVREGISGAVYSAVLALVLITGYQWIAGGGIKHVLRELTGVRR